MSAYQCIICGRRTKREYRHYITAHPLWMVAVALIIVFIIIPCSAIFWLGARIEDCLNGRQHG